MLIDSKDIGGTAEVAAVLECPKQQIRSLQRNPRFPKPIEQLAATPLWDLAEVRRFKETWKRRSQKDKANGSEPPST